MTTVNIMTPQPREPEQEPVADPIPKLVFEAGLAGFPQAVHFALVEVEDTPLFVLRSLDTADLEFVVTPPAVFFPDYVADVDAADVDRLGLTGPEDALLLVLLTVGPDLAASTANLQAPVVLNQRTLQAAQVLLASGEHSLRAPLAG